MDLCTCVCVFLSVSSSPLLSSPLLSSPLLSSPQASVCLKGQKNTSRWFYHRHSAMNLCPCMKWVMPSLPEPQLSQCVCVCVCVCDELTVLHVMAVCACRSWRINDIWVKGIRISHLSCVCLFLICAGLSAYLSIPPPSFLSLSLSLGSLTYPEGVRDLKGRGWKHKLTTESEWVAQAERRGKWRDRPCKRDGRKRLSPISIW